MQMKCNPAQQNEIYIYIYIYLQVPACGAIQIAIYQSLQNYM